MTEEHFTSMVCFKLMISVIALIALIDQSDAEYTVRVTNYGKVRGFVETVHAHKRVEKFLGIPYASPPVGKLRFEVGLRLFSYS